MLQAAKVIFFFCKTWFCVQVFSSRGPQKGSPLSQWSVKTSFVSYLTFFIYLFYFFISFRSKLLAFKGAKFSILENEA